MKVNSWSVARLNTCAAFIPIGTTHMAQRIEEKKQRATHGNFALLQTKFIGRQVVPVFESEGVIAWSLG